MAIEELEGKDTNVSSRKGVFIPDITVEMFRNASLEGVEELMASGKMEDISLPSAQPERPKGEWITDDLSGIISCSRCGNAAPMETTSGRQYKSKFCQTCGADMNMADDAQYFVDVEEALNMATNVLTAQTETHDKRIETHARDCISRADVEQTVEDNILCYTHSDRPIDQDPDTECHKAIRTALRMLRKDLRKLPSAQPDNRLSKIAELVEGTIDHFDLDDAMDLLYQIKEIVGNETSNI